MHLFSLSENVEVEKIKVRMEEMFNKMFLMLIMRCHTTKAVDDIFDTHGQKHNTIPQASFAAR